MRMRKSVGLRALPHIESWIVEETSIWTLAKYVQVLG